MDSRRTRTAGAFLTGFVLSLALTGGAISAMHYWSPGYEFGRQNCGPATGGRRTYASCVSCCMRGAQQEDYPADESGGCHHFCKRVPWSIWASS